MTQSYRPGDELSTSRRKVAMARLWNKERPGAAAKSKVSQNVWGAVQTRLSGATKAGAPHRSAATQATGKPASLP